MLRYRLYPHRLRYKFRASRERMPARPRCGLDCFVRGRSNISDAPLLAAFALIDDAITGLSRRSSAALIVRIGMGVILGPDEV